MKKLFLCLGLLTVSFHASSAINFQLFVENSSEEKIVVRKVKYKIKNSSWETVQPSKNRTFGPGDCTGYTGERCSNGKKRRYSPWSVANVFGECGHGQKRLWKVQIKCGNNVYKMKTTCSGNTRVTQSNCKDSIEILGCDTKDKIQFSENCK